MAVSIKTIDTLKSSSLFNAETYGAHQFGSTLLIPNKGCATNLPPEKPSGERGGSGLLPE